MVQEHQVGAPADVVHYVSSRKKRGKLRGKRSTQPPLTPMIDVVFQLLLFFLLACQFRQNEGQLRANLPDTKGPPTPAVTKPIRIRLSRPMPGSEQVRIAIEDLGPIESWPQLQKTLKDQRGRFPYPEKIPVLIQPDPDVPWAHAVNAYSQAVSAKYKKVALQPSEG